MAGAEFLLPTSPTLKHILNPLMSLMRGSNPMGEEDEMEERREGDKMEQVWSYRESHGSLVKPG